MKTLILLFLLIAAPIYAADSTTPGPGVDKSGNTVIDPTKNVDALVAAEAKRLDQLREASDKLLAAELRRIDELRKVAEERAIEIRIIDSRRLDDLRAAESRRVDEEARLRSDYAQQLAIAESNRINAIRAVDVGQVAAANVQQTQTASVLAAQVTASAETLRNQVTASADALRNLVATTATTQAEQNRQQAAAFSERLSALEKAQNESKGRSGVSDPQLEKLNAVVEKLATAQSLGSGNTQGSTATTALFLTLGGLALTLILGLGGFLLNQSRKNTALIERNGTRK